MQVPIGVFGFLILLHFLFQTNYVAYHSSSFYQVLSRPNDPKKMEHAPLCMSDTRMIRYNKSSYIAHGSQHGDAYGLFDDQDH